ncbi:hypothetical protein BO70DRAFT_400952 [Aspergillus heteromorphus CBS 117.55]|uniref:P-loop containing nucleoside triphosphate hydrolase protein n=1 Tax=Aspergillus heteromorphus CBS 117.55 TaxID=1448321 RepID=A0A317UZP9_9EURO|nr:uncharacterized protein BO70DRAFT_400952 [Aspergillus heteromorphus CBS 117.55]PWY66002.1 hypothetical protein BO70DRAFT_400952 [Aspergillus heteromorphus CBS 117.55]
MPSFFTRLRTLFGGPSTPTGPFPKIGIIGEDSVGKLALLRHLSDTPISQYTPDINVRNAEARLGTNHQLGFDYVVVNLSANGPRRWVELNASLYADSDALVVVVDFFNPAELDTLRYHLMLSVRGGGRGKLDFYPTVKKGIPWLVLVNFKAEPLVGLDSCIPETFPRAKCAHQGGQPADSWSQQNKDEAKEQVDRLKLDELGADWV